VSAVTDINPQDIKEKPDLILLDVLLAGKNGKDICSSLKNNSSTKDIPVIMFSGLSDARQQCLDAGADEFILKPFKIPVLVNLIKKLSNNTPALQSTY
jgi:DNA-binding response OmpR family regulator